MMIKVMYSELIKKESIAEIDTEDFLEWAGGLPASSELLAEYLGSGRGSWQSELEGLTGHRVADGGEIWAVEHW